MRTIAQIRNYALLVFFVIMVGGVLLRPGTQRSPAPVAERVAVAGIAN
jgi:hypothetical protein